MTGDNAAGSGTLSSLQGKYDTLRENIGKMGSVLVAFSAGVDSTVLLKVAHDELGDKAAAVTARSCLNAQCEYDEAVEFCEEEGIELFLVDVDPFQIDGFAANPPERCYMCKMGIFTKLKELAAEKGFEHLCEGTNASDLTDWRPGHKAIDELGAESPLLEVGMTKDEIRVLGLSLGIPNWDKPSAACLATRVPTGEEITPRKIEMAGAAEQLMRDANFEQFRVRVHGNLARIEVAEEELDDLYEFGRDPGFLEEMHRIGFKHVTFDLEGYRKGSNNL